MKKLTEKDILRFIKEEWAAKVAELEEVAEITATTKVDGKKIETISAGLKIKNKTNKGRDGKKGNGEGYLYTVIFVNPEGYPPGFIIRPPDGPMDGQKDFFIDKETLEKEYGV
jgi:hypothetical protein